MHSSELLNERLVIISSATGDQLLPGQESHLGYTEMRCQDAQIQVLLRPLETEPAFRTREIQTLTIGG
jgi:hypothetical protein